MFKSTLLPLVCLLALLFFSGNVLANDASPPFTNGEAYVTLDHAQRLSPKGNVELVEVFSYACIHCARFAPYMDKLVKSLPKSVSVHYVPAAFNPAWEAFARAFYAAKQLGVLEQTHLALFKDKFTHHYPINSLSDLADFYAHHGVDRDKFLQIAQSDAVTKKIKANRSLIEAWGVEGTPTIIVNGKYRSHRIHSYKELAELARWLVKKELQETSS